MLTRHTLAALAALICIFVGHTAAAQSSAPNGKVVFAVGEWPPFVSEIEPGYGVHARLVTKTFEAAGYQVVYDFMPWQRAAAAVAAGQYVATFPWQHTELRATRYLISERPVGPNLSVAYYQRARFPKGLKGGTLGELAAAGYSFVGVRSYIHTLVLTEMGANLHIVSDSELAWKMLARGRIDIYIDNELVGDTERVEFLGSERASEFAKSDPISNDPLYILFSRGHPQSSELMEVWDAYATN